LQNRTAKRRGLQRPFTKETIRFTSEERYLPILVIGLI